MMALLCAALATAGPAHAQASQSSTNSSPPAPAPSSPQDGSLNLPVSLDKIKVALTEAPATPFITLADKPHFTLEVRARQKIRMEDLIATMDFKSGPAVPGGLYGFEQNRLVNPTVDNPLRQPYAAFSQSELLAIVIENLAAKYLGGRALNAVTSAERARAEQAARDEVQRALADFWASQKGSFVSTTPKQ